LEEVVLRRGSSRRFKPESISFAHFSTILAESTTGFSADWREPEDPFLNNLYINVHAVDDLAAGSYHFQPRDGLLTRLKSGNFRGDSAHLCLGQALGGDSSFTVFFLADLDHTFSQYGARGYRLVQMEAGVLGGKLYLSAYALGLGASGLTFFDDMTVDFFRPHARGKDAIFVTALGIPGRPIRRSGRIERIKKPTFFSRA
jgi:SagB-type dehydrogenase family enzyme